MSTATLNANENESIPVDGIWEMEVAESTGDGNFVPCPPGNFPARICGLFDVGLQPETRTDNKTGVTSNVQVRKLVLVYELTKKQADGKPYVMGDRYTWSMRDNSNFYKLVCNVVGSRFSPGQKFNPTSLLGQLVMVNVTNSPANDKGRVYANVGSVSQFPEGFPAPAFVHEPIMWSVLEGKPFPPSSWLPFIYGKTIAELANGAATPAPAAKPQPQPAAHPVPAATLGSPTSVPPHIAPMLGKYGLTWPIEGDDLRARKHLIPPGDFEVLETVAIPF